MHDVSGTTDASSTPRRLFLLDGHSLAYRAFFALPPTLATSSGTVTNAVYGFTSMLIKLLGDEHPDLIAVAFDTGAPTVRLEMDAEYKAGRRETPADFGPQLTLIEEVLATLKIPVIRVEGHEADDALGTLATRASDEGIDAVIVTADRDFFQLARERQDGRGAISVLFNRRGISEIDDMGPAEIEAKYGVSPASYLDYVALKGDTSDNIPGVPGVGEKTAAKLVQEFGSVEDLLARSSELRGKLKENVTAAADRLALNKQLARIVTDVELDVGPEDAVMGGFDPDAVRRLFVSLEFRSLIDRLQEAIGATKPKAEVAELDLRRAEAEELVAVLRRAPAALRLTVEEGRVRGAAVSAGGAQAAYADLDGLGPLGAPLADPEVALWTHDAKSLERAVAAEGGVVAGVAFDTMLAGYLLDPAAAQYPLRALSERYLGADVLGDEQDEEAGQLFAEDPWRTTAAEAAAVALLAPVLEEEVERQSLRPSWRTSSCRSRRCWPVWRREACGSIPPTSTRWATRSATAWPRSWPRSTRPPATSSTSTPHRSSVRSSTRSSGCSPGGRPRRANCRPTPASSRSSVRSTRSSMPCCPGASSTSSTPRTSRRCRRWSIRVTAGSTRRSTRRSRPPAG